MGYRVDAGGYSCTKCGKRHDDRESACECGCEVRFPFDVTVVHLGEMLLRGVRYATDTNAAMQSLRELAASEWPMLTTAIWAGAINEEAARERNLPWAVS